MLRSIGAFLAGLAAWVVVVTLLDRALRIGIPGYALAEPAMQFTLGMKVARLTIAAITSVAAGAVVGAIARPQPGTVVTFVLGALLVAGFVPTHVRLWSVFPLWYHLSFLVPLVPLLLLGQWLTRSRSPAPRDAAVGHASG
jgi:hypothetical protein